jgi:hypothetical protein
MYNLKRGNLDFGDYDIAKIEVAHDALLELGVDLHSKTLSNLRDLTKRMYKNLSKTD